MSSSDQAKAVSPIDGLLALPQDDVRNPVPVMDVGNLFTADRLLVDVLRQAGGRWIEPRAKAVGAIMAAEGVDWAERRESPRLQKFDRSGYRIDGIHQSDAWRQLTATARQYGLHSLTAVDNRDGVHAARAAMLYTLGQVAPSVIAPISVTHAGFSVLEQAGQAVQKACFPSLAAVGELGKSAQGSGDHGASLGLAIAEKHAVSATAGGELGFATIAQPISGRGAGGGAAFELTGHKWWAVVPQADALIVLAKSPLGPSCFLVPKQRPDGSRNRIQIQSLTPAFTDAPEAVASLEFHGAFATLIGEEGQGFAVIHPMHQRLMTDQVVVLAAIQRQLLTQLLHVSAHRTKGGKSQLSDLSVKQTIADLCLEVEAAMRMAMQLAGWLDTPPAHPQLQYLGALAAKYWLMRRVPMAVTEAMDVVGFHARSDHDRALDFDGAAAFVALVDGGLGLEGVNDSVSGQLCDDALALLRQDRSLGSALMSYLKGIADAHPVLGLHLERLAPVLDSVSDMDQRYGRRALELIALALQAAVVLPAVPPSIGSLFNQTRLDADRGHSLGSSPMPGDLDEVIDRLRLQAG
ncbi:MAG: hypothetical protein KI792_10790 [Alphaproteobacteria bacterium]|nr:hypothetical protein [Alphaproteobacteria bacterium SS10]